MVLTPAMLLPVVVFTATPFHWLFAFSKPPAIDSLEHALIWVVPLAGFYVGVRAESYLDVLKASLVVSLLAGAATMLTLVLSIPNLEISFSHFVYGVLDGTFITLIFVAPGAIAGLLYRYVRKGGFRRWKKDSLPRRSAL